MNISEEEHLRNLKKLESKLDSIKQELEVAKQELQSANLSKDEERILNAEFNVEMLSGAIQNIEDSIKQSKKS